jgi:hypothetical protein
MEANTNINTVNEKGEILKAISDVIKDTKKLFNISREVYKGNPLVVNDQLVTPSDVQSWKSELIENLKKIRSDVRALKVMKKRAVNKERKATGGLNGPSFFDMRFVEFFREANLGPAYRFDPTTNTYVEIDKDLRNQLKLFLSTGIVRSSSLTTLFTIYFNTHPDVVCPNDRQYIRADELMEKHFGEVFKTFENFDKNHFPRTTTTVIAYRFVIKKANLTDEQKKLLESNQEAIAKEAEVVKDTNAYYKQKRQAEEKQAKAEEKAKKKLEEAAARTSTVTNVNIVPPTQPKLPIALTSPKKQQVALPKVPTQFPPIPPPGMFYSLPMMRIPARVTNLDSK